MLLYDLQNVFVSIFNPLYDMNKNGTVKNVFLFKVGSSRLLIKFVEQNTVRQTIFVGPISNHHKIKFYTLNDLLRLAIKFV